MAGKAIVIATAIYIAIYIATAVISVGQQKDRREEGGEEERPAQEGGEAPPRHGARGVGPLPPCPLLACRVPVAETRIK